MLYTATLKVDNVCTAMKKDSPLHRQVFKSNRLQRLSIRTVLFVACIWILAILVSNINTLSFSWFGSDIESLRNLLASVFQGLASFFAIIISVSLLVSQLAYGSFSPRLMPNFLKNKYFQASIFLFFGAISLNLILLSLLSGNTLNNLIYLINFDLLLSLVALLSVVPATFALLSSAHPMNIGLDLVERFDDEYFEKLSSRESRDLDDDCLPLLQALIVKSLRDADTDFARRLLGSFVGSVESHLDDDNAKTFVNYFDSFFKKVSFVASQEKEEGVLKQLIFANESFETKVCKSKKYLSSSHSMFDGSFVRNITSIIELSVKNDHDQVIWTAYGALARLRQKTIQSIPADNEISTFRTITSLRDKKEMDDKNTSEHFTNESIYEYIKKAYFESNISLASIALERHSSDALHHIVGEIFRTRYDLEKLDLNKHREAVKSIAYSNYFGLSKLSQSALKKHLSIASEIANGVFEARDFFLNIDPKLAESYADLLGEQIIEITERDIIDSDPTTTFYWTGVALRMSLTKNTPIAIPMKLLISFEKVLKIVHDRQLNSPSPILGRMKETVCREIASVRKYKEADETVLKKSEEILAKYPEVNIED